MTRIFYLVSVCLYFPWCTQQEQKLCCLRCPEVLAAQRYRGGKHHLWQSVQQTAVRTPQLTVTALCSDVLHIESFPDPFMGVFQVQSSD